MAAERPKTCPAVLRHPLRSRHCSWAGRRPEECGFYMGEGSNLLLTSRPLRLWGLRWLGGGSPGRAVLETSPPPCLLPGFWSLLPASRSRRDLTGCRHQQRPTVGLRPCMLVCHLPHPCPAPVCFTQPQCLTSPQRSGRSHPLPQLCPGCGGQEVAAPSLYNQP